jgi:hypothetical protein
VPPLWFQSSAGELLAFLLRHLAEAFVPCNTRVTGHDGGQTSSSSSSIPRRAIDAPENGLLLSLPRARVVNQLQEWGLHHNLLRLARSPVISHQTATLINATQGSLSTG